MMPFNSLAWAATPCILYTPFIILLLLLWFAYLFHLIFYLFFQFIFLHRKLAPQLSFLHQFLFPPYPQGHISLQNTFLFYRSALWIVVLSTKCCGSWEGHTVTTNTADSCSAAYTFQQTAGCNLHGYIFVTVTKLKAGSNSSMSYMLSVLSPLCSLELKTCCWNQALRIGI